ncbi:MAG: lipoate--protein ligase family protein [Methanobacteriota archaeon]|nr:MAG: lipoate--protein ligase family protein [Euryarchaeota archaeon]
MMTRLLRTGHLSAAVNMAIDEIVLHRVASGQAPPTFRLYGWKPPAVSIGYFQSLAEEVDLEVCKECGVDIVRRITGGGAVFHDAEVTYSTIVPQNWEAIPESIPDSYQFICNGIIEGLKDLGVKASFQGLNDIAVGGKKISGNAQTRRKGVVLQHGTILIDVDPEKMFSLLRVPSEKTRKKLIKSARERVTGLNDVVDEPADFEDVVSALAVGFEKTLALRFDREQLADREIEEAEKLADEKYATSDWNHMR